MSGNVINLRLARKTKARAARESEAAVNRARHGRTRTDRDAAAFDAEIAARRLDGHRLDSGCGPDDGDAA